MKLLLKLSTKFKLNENIMLNGKLMDFDDDAGLFGD